MKTKEIFQLAIRLLGLAFVYLGLSGLPGSVSAVLTAVMAGNVLGVLVTMLMVLWPLLMAFWLIRGGRLLMRIAYPETP